MQDRYWMFQRNGVFYLEDKLNGKQKSLKTRDAAAARRMLAGKNQATEIPQMKSRHGEGLSVVQIGGNARPHVGRCDEGTWNRPIMAPRWPAGARK